MIFSNPYGLLGLLGIPIILVIHFFQRRAKALPVSTLFLVQQTQRESARGRNFERLLNSPPLWLQLLMVLLFTWLLSGPRYLKEASVQKLAVVVDSSASMAVFKGEAIAKIDSELEKLRGNASAVEFFLLDSDPSKARIYHGDSRQSFLEAFRAWEAGGSAHGVRDSLKMARSMVGEKGSVVYLTDREVTQPEFGTHVFAVGQEVANCGMTGVEFERRDGDLVWRVSVKNYAAVPQVREWFVELAGGQRSSKRSVELPARGVVTLQGLFPEGQDVCKVWLSEDAFVLDDVMPVVRPQPKEVQVLSTGELEGLDEKLVRSFEGVIRAQDASEVDVSLVRPSSEVEGDAIVFVKGSGGKYQKGEIVAEKHPLMDGLNWQSLLVRESAGVPHTEHDTVLLWQGDRALLYLRGGEHEVLVVNFDWEQSNAQKQEAFVVLLWRFVERLRRAKVGFESLNVETGQMLEVATDPLAGSGMVEFREVDLNGSPVGKGVEVRPAHVTALGKPGFFKVQQGGVELVHGGAHFADTREADFTDCVEQDIWAPELGEAVDRHTEEDHLWRYVVLMIVVALLGSWFFTNKRIG
ncbi:BatA domain-containing protein [Rubritalea tangerina]|uniref:BatA domain-containing protein n=1 Tax=Rubritalea tangerina TaxID=430798 RepID=A0ABW4ZAI5_9BACT